jgi:uncharacterized protein (TIGR00730 family)
MHERKIMMFEESDAFMALPGGFGTLEEIVEVLTWRQLGLHDKPTIFVNLEGFWSDLLSVFDRLAESRFLSTDDRCLATCVASIEDACAALGLVQK